MSKCWFNPDAGSVQYCFDFMQTADNGRGLSLARMGELNSDAMWLVPIIKNGEFRKNGIIVNYCPFCGTKLLPLVSKEHKYAVKEVQING